MVNEDLRGRDISDPAVLKAMLKVPRHLFVRPQYTSKAYADHPLPIKENQTISQPYIVALMTQSARLKPTDRVLEIGTGSAYQAAVLGEIVREVYSIEIIKTLADQARARLHRLGYENVSVKHGDGYRGWPEHAPFDAILVTAAPEEVPEPLIEQLAAGGRIVIPVGARYEVQMLKVLTKTEDGLVIVSNVIPVRFVPLTRDEK